jgi:hypothetical protein
MIIDETGNVGIGTSAPGNLLTVSSFGTQINIRQENTGILTNGNTIHTNYGFGAATNIHGRFGMTMTNNAGLGVADYIWQVFNGASLLERMRLTSAGNLGVGTNDPANTLHISAATVANTAGVRLPVTSATAPQIINNRKLTVNSSGDIVLASTADSVVNNQTVAYTLTAADAGNIVAINSASPVNVTLSGLSVGQSVRVYQQGAGQLTFVSGTLTRRHVFNLFSTAGQFSIVEITVIGTDAVLAGQLA